MQLDPARCASRMICVAVHKMSALALTDAYVHGPYLWAFIHGMLVVPVKE
jgi:hypothetical protein